MSGFLDGSDLAPEVNWSAGTVPGTTGNADPNAAGVAGSAGITLGTGTGQQGTVLAPNLTLGGSMQSGFNKVWSLLNEPFNTPMSPVSIALLVGVILIAIVGWNFVLYHVRIAAEAI